MNVLDYFDEVDIVKGSWVIGYLMCEDCTPTHICELHAKDIKAKLQKEDNKKWLKDTMNQLQLTR